MSVSRGTREASPGERDLLDGRIGRFLELLLRWNDRINLVADRDPATIRQRHIADALQLLPMLPPGEKPIGDLGSGAGFPGLVLAMAVTRPVHLIEADRRKAAFLTEAAAQLGLHHVHIHPQRIEIARPPPLAVVTARALAPLDILLGHAERLLEPGGLALFPKGRTAEVELTEALRRWNFRAERIPSRTDPEAAILRLSQIRRAEPGA